MEILQIYKVCIAVVPFSPIDFLMERVLLNLLYEQIVPMGETSKVATGFQEGAQSKNLKHVEESRSTLHTAFRGSGGAFRPCIAICQEYSPCNMP